MQEDIRKVLAGSLPIALTPTTVRRAMAQIEGEEASQAANLISENRTMFVAAVTNKLFSMYEKGTADEILSAIHSVDSETKPLGDTTVQLHGSGARVLGRLEGKLQESGIERDRLLELPSVLARSVSR